MNDQVPSLTPGEPASAADLRALGMAVMRAHGVDADIAATVVDVLLYADERGVASHGLTRLPGYLARIGKGLVDPNARASMLTDAGSLVLMSANNGFGAVAASDAVALLAERTAAHGIAGVSVRDANHFGMVACYTGALAELGYAAFGWTNAGPAVAAFGGKRAVLGTNPISIAVPGGGEPVILDMATTTVARGKIRRAKTEGREIPPGLALDANGVPTIDPAAALEGTLASLGGYKGYGLAAMVELLSGVLTGGAFLTGVRGMMDLGGAAGVSFTFVAADISRIVEPGDYARRLSEFRDVVASSADDARIYLPGEPERERRERIRREGIRLGGDVVEALYALLAERRT